ncbi:MAG: PHP domain-containing protein, partial [Acidobacteriota bacterium]
LGRMRLSEADQLVRPLLEYMQEAPGLEKLDVAGSYRRREETVGDIDLLAVAEESGPLMEHFTEFDQVQRVESAGDTKGTVILRSDLQVDLRVLPARSYGAAMHYFTGSKEHNVAVRERGVRQGLRINEYGVFRVPEDADPDEMEPQEGERVGGEEEQDVFDAVGLEWIPPELRENRGEIEAAAEGKLPELITVDDIRGDLQMHSEHSDGDATIEEMARACAERGYEYLAITDHSQRVSVTRGLDEEALEEQWKEIEAIRERLGDDIRLLRSLEVDILEDGSLDLDDEHLEGLDLVVVSVHSYMDLSRKEQTERIIEAISHPEVDILAHPTGRRINEREPYELDMEAVLEAAKEHDVALEINANPARLDLNDRHAFRTRELGADIVISTDAHSVDNLDLMRYGVDQARRAWLQPEQVINTLSLSDFEAWLGRGS